MRLKEILPVGKEAAKRWGQDKVTRHAAALSYYTVFSLAPLLLIAISVAGLVFGQDAARHRIVGEIQGFVGMDGAHTVETLIQNAAKPKTGIIAAAAGALILVFGASGVFGQIQDSLNSIWGVRPKSGRGLVGIVKDRFASFSMVVVIGFLLLVSLLMSAALSAVAAYLGGLLPGANHILLRAADLGLGFGIVTLLFALIYKVLPDVRIGWSDVWIGSAATALLFTLGRFLIGLYLGRSGVASTFGAAGSLAVILIWVYYSSQILFFGAEFTKAYATRMGSHVVPTANSELIPEARPAGSGAPTVTTPAAMGATRTDENPRHTAKRVPAADAEPSREAARIRRGAALLWRHRRAFARAGALAVPILWAFTGKAADPLHAPKRRRRR
jgi:membrane protein